MRTRLSIRRGAILPLVALGLLGFIGMVALVVDLGWVYSRQRQWQNAVTSAALAGYKQLRADRQNNDGVTLLGLFQPTASADCGGSGAAPAKGLATSYKTSQLAKVVKAFGIANGFEIKDPMITLGADRITIEGHTPVGLFVAPLFGLDRVDVSGHATVINGRLSANQSTLIPLAIPHGDVKDLPGGVVVDPLPTGQFEVGQEYVLKTGLGLASPSRILVPMDGTQAEHVAAYGVAYWALATWQVEWLINYRGGSFMFPYDSRITSKLTSRGVTHQVLNFDPCNGVDEAAAVYAAAPIVLPCFIKPKLGAFSNQGSDEETLRVLHEAEIPYGNYAPALTDTYNRLSNTTLYDAQVLAELHADLDWLYAHHEDFSGNDANKNPEAKTLAAAKGFKNVNEMKQDVTWRIRNFVAAGGHFFTMCFGTTSFDAALAERAQRLNAADIYADCLAFTGFTLMGTGGNPKDTGIDDKDPKDFTLQDMNDPKCQDHDLTVKDLGNARCRAFNLAKVKASVKRLGLVDVDTIKYMSGVLGAGDWCFMGGHRPHFVPAKRLFLNNVLLASRSSRALARLPKTFGPVDLDGSDANEGAAHYQQVFDMGWSASLGVGAKLLTETGNLERETRRAVSLRFAGDPNATKDTVQANSSRVVTVPIVKLDSQVAANSAATTLYQYKSRDRVEVIGLAQFLLSNVPFRPASRTDNGPVTTGQVRGVFLRYLVKP
jgi:hypothetical protein